MASTYSTNLKIEIMATGENSGTWGTITNTNLGTALEQAIVGYGNPSFASDANLTLTYTDTNAAQAARALVLNVTSAVSLTGTRELVVPTIQKQYIVQNNTTGSQSITVKTSGGTGITVPNGRKAHLYVDGTNVIQMFDFVDINGGAIDGTTVGASSASTGAFTTLTASGATTLNGAVALGDASADLITVPGTVNSNVIFTDNTFDIGASGATRPRTGYFGTSVLSPLVTATNVQVTNVKANDGTVAVTITDSTGAVGVSTAFTLSTATGNIALGTSQTSGTWTAGGAAQTGNITLDQSTKAHTLNIGTGATENATTKTINIGTGGVSGSTTTITIGSSNGTTTTFNGTVNVTTLDLTNLEVTNIKAKDGTAAITLADSTGVATLSANPILNAGTANGVAFLNASKVLTTGSALIWTGGTAQLGFQNAAANGYAYIANAGAGTNTDLAFYMGASEGMRLTSTGLGIGTTSPNAKLTVGDPTGAALGIPTTASFYGTSSISSSVGTIGLFSTETAGADVGPALTFGGKSGNTFSPYPFAFIQGAKESATAGNYAGYLRFLTVPADGSSPVVGMHLSSVGNLGIGTNAPGAKLHVSGGNIRLDNNQGVEWGGGNNFIYGNEATDFVAIATNGSERARITSTGTLNIVGAGTAGTNQAISFNGSTPVDTLVTTSGGLVGVGTASPASKLEVRGVSASIQTRAAALNSFLGAPISGNVGVVNDTNSLVLQVANTVGGNTAGVSIAALLEASASNQTAMVFSADDGFGSLVARMRLNSSGNLGIGTSSPAVKLHVVGANGSGAVQIGTSSGSNEYQYVTFGGSVGGTDYGWQIGRSSNTSGLGGNGAFYFYDIKANTTRMSIDASGNLGLGVTPSAWGTDYKAIQIGGSATGALSYKNFVTSLSQNVYSTNANDVALVGGYAAKYELNGSGQHVWKTAAVTENTNISFTQAMTLDASGNLGVGTTLQNERLRLNSSSASQARMSISYADSTIAFFGSYSGIVGSGNATDVMLSATNVLAFGAGGTAERARITSGGGFLVGRQAAVGSELLCVEGSNADFLSRIRNTSATTPSGLFVSYTAAAPNGTGSLFLRCDDSAATRAEIRSNGGLANYQSNNVDLSDARTKTDISPLGSYWNKIAGLEIVTYKYKDQTHDDLNIGVIAQQVEQVAPEFVDSDGFGDTPEDGVPLKTIYNKDLTFAAIKALQEAMARIETLEAEVAALKGV
jgi:hypothetical protein